MFHKDRLLWGALIGALVLGAIWEFFPLPDAQERMQQLALSGPAYKGKDLALSDWEKSFFYKVNVTKRLYEVDNQPFFITALDGTHNRHVVHDPYYCFRGSGWEIVNHRSLSLPAGSAALLTLKKDGREQEALYWFSDGKSQYDSPFQYWKEATLRRLTLGLSGPEPILIVVQPLYTERPDWESLIRYFPDLFQL